MLVEEIVSVAVSYVGPILWLGIEHYLGKKGGVGSLKGGSTISIALSAIKGGFELYKALKEKKEQDKKSDAKSQGEAK